MIIIVFLEDFSQEITRGTTSPSYARTLCSYSCSKDFYGVRRYHNSHFRCRCFDRDDGIIVGEDAIINDPRVKPDCDVVGKVYEDLFTADSSLNAFMKESSLSLMTTDGQENDTQGRANLCIDNNVRRINIATLYLAKALGLSVSNIINNYVYDTNVSSYTYPSNSSNPQIYPPTGSVLTSFPLLDQAYWTIVSQYTRFTEDRLDSGKSTHWCWWVGVGMLEHCIKTKTELGCNNVYCSYLHKRLVEACHRVRSRDPSASDYTYSSNTNKFCLPSVYSDAGYTELTLYEVSRE